MLAEHFGKFDYFVTSDAREFLSQDGVDELFISDAGYAFTPKQITDKVRAMHKRKKTMR